MANDGESISFLVVTTFSVREKCYQFMIKSYERDELFDWPDYVKMSYL